MRLAIFDACFFFEMFKQRSLTVFIGLLSLFEILVQHFIVSDIKIVFKSSIALERFLALPKSLLSIPETSKATHLITIKTHNARQPMTPQWHHPHYWHALMPNLRLLHAPRHRIRLPRPPRFRIVSYNNLSSPSPRILIPKPTSDYRPDSAPVLHSDSCNHSNTGLHGC